MSIRNSIVLTEEEETWRYHLWAVRRLSRGGRRHQNKQGIGSTSHRRHQHCTRPSP